MIQFQVQVNIILVLNYARTLTHFILMLSI